MKFLRHLLWKYVTQNPQYDEVQVPCPEISIPQIDGDLYEKLLAEANSAGASFEGSKASISGLEFDWNYDLESQTLNVTCTKKPFYATCGEVENRIQELIQKARTSI